MNAAFEASPRLDPPRGERAADLLTLGFGAAVAMWSIGYFCRLFGPAVPAPLLFALMLGCLAVGGFFAGRATPRGIVGGIWTGLIAGLVNLLIIGSLLGGDTPNSIRTAALIWVPGSVIASILVAAAGAAIGVASRRHPAPPTSWLGGLPLVASVATFVLLCAGGLVTGFDEGLAVVDWPNSEGYNMFLYPLARMTGGVYLEHAHRLLGSLVGLVTLTFAVHVQLTERRVWVKALAWTALFAVVAQGVLGGLRVTGVFTLSTDPNNTAPNIILAIVHGVFGQMVFGLLVALAAFRSRLWRSDAAPQVTYAPSADRFMGWLLVGLVIVQLVLGAVVRHFTWALDINRYGLEADAAHLRAVGERALMLHITMAVGVLILALAFGARTWGLYAAPRLRTLGKTMVALLTVQLALGLLALLVVADDAATHRPKALDVAITTSHQVVGAAILACAVLGLAWNYRLARLPEDAAVTTRQAATVTV